MVTESLKLGRDRAGELYNTLLGSNYLIKVDSNPYLEWKLSNDSFTVMYYRSGKLVVQGNGDINSILGLLGNSAGGREVNEGKGESYIAHIGADEVGKGDYFGPLVVGACYVPDKSYKGLVEAGVGDSKKIADTKIHSLYNTISKSCEYTVTVIQPSLYNTLYEKYGNIARLLSQSHADNIQSLIEKLGEKGIEYNLVVIDQFSSNKGRLESVLKGIKFNQMHKAESLDLPTACASIVARKYFLDYFEKMNLEHGFLFPKGATHVIDGGKRFVQMYGSEKLKDVAKVSFKTTQQILGF